MPTPDHYATLHVAPEATTAEIRRNYIRLAKAFHPDTGDGDERVASEVTTAWNVLKDPARRAAYDATLQAEREAAQAPDPSVADDESFEDSWGTAAPWRPGARILPRQALTRRLDRATRRIPAPTVRPTRQARRPSIHRRRHPAIHRRRRRTLRPRPAGSAATICVASHPPRSGSGPRGWQSALFP